MTTTTTTTTPAFDLKDLIDTFSTAFENMASKDAVTIDEGFRMFEGANNDLKGNDTVDSDTFRAALVEAGLDVPRFQDLFATAERLRAERVEAAFKLAEEQKALAKDAEKFSTQVKNALEEAKKNGENCCTIGYVPHRVFKSFTGHIGNRNVTDHVKGDYLKGKIDPVKRAEFRKVTVLKLDPKKNAVLWAEIMKANPVHSLPYVLGDSHCRQYATCKASGDENGFRMENPGTWEVTVIEGFTDDQTVEYIRSRGSKDSLLSAKDIRVVEMRRHKIDPAKVSKFVAAPWKTAFKVAGIKNGDEKVGMAEFHDAIRAIDSLKIEIARGGKASQGVKATMLQTYKDCTDDEGALSKWVSFWTNFFNEDADQPAKVSKIISKLCGSGYPTEAKTCDAMLKIYNEIILEQEAA